MSRPRSSNLVNAVDDIKDGMSIYRAAKKNGLDYTTVKRAINPGLKERCPVCGKTITKKRKDRS